MRKNILLILLNIVMIVPQFAYAEVELLQTVNFYLLNDMPKATQIQIGINGNSPEIIKLEQATSKLSEAINIAPGELLILSNSDFKAQCTYSYSYKYITTLLSQGLCPGLRITRNSSCQLLAYKNKASTHCELNT